MLVTTCFKSVYIDKEHYLLYSMLIVLIVYLLNITVKKFGNITHHTLVVLTVRLDRGTNLAVETLLQHLATLRQLVAKVALAERLNQLLGVHVVEQFWLERLAICHTIVIGLQVAYRQIDTALLSLVDGAVVENILGTLLLGKELVGLHNGIHGTTLGERRCNAGLQDTLLCTCDGCSPINRLITVVV